jgi:hypothetical protein
MDVDFASHVTETAPGANGSIERCPHAITRTITFAHPDRQPAGSDGRQPVIGHAVDRSGQRHDLRNIIDAVRRLLPTPPVPTRWRCDQIAPGSGDPTRVSPYYQAVKPTLEAGFNPHRMTCAQGTGQEAST